MPTSAEPRPLSTQTLTVICVCGRRAKYRVEYHLIDDRYLTKPRRKRPRKEHGGRS